MSIAGVSVKYVCDRDAAKTAKIAALYPSVLGTSDITEILQDAGVNAVVVATPASTHFDIIQKCLSAKKHVLAEKPLTLKASESETLISISKKQQVLLMVGHTFLFNSAVRRIKEYTESGELGDIYYLNATRTHLGLIREDVNAVWDLAPHDVSVFNYLLGAMPLSVSAAGACFLKPGREDAAFINLKYPKNIIANIHVSWADSNKERTIRIVGSKARVVFNDLDNLERVKLYQKGIALTIHEQADDFGSFQLVQRDGDIISPRITLNEPLKDQCIHFTDCIKNRTEPLTGGINGYEVVKVMEAVDRSIHNNGEVIEIN